MIIHIPTSIAQYNGCASENVATKKDMIPKMTINTDATFDIVSCANKMPIIPININTNEMI